MENLENGVKFPEPLLDACSHNGFHKPKASAAKEALDLAVNYSLEDVLPDGHWYGELKYVTMSGKDCSQLINTFQEQCNYHGGIRLSPAGLRPRFDFRS